MLRHHPASPVSPLTEALDPAIRLDAIARRFGQRWVLRGIDLVVDPGEVLVLTGRNGSGKTTLLRIIGTMLPADAWNSDGLRPRYRAIAGGHPRVGWVAGPQQRAV
jgi:ABC-type molybdenum transport system ATPase subunit/photorepair protein PhrA